MSKRKNRKRTPNLPEETLSRARHQAGLEPIESVEEDAEAVVEQEAAPEPQLAAKKAAAPARSVESQTTRRRRGDVQPVKYKPGSKDKPLDSAAIADLLAHPIKEVSEEELKNQYNYVLADLRSMGILAAVLFVVLIAIAQLL